VCVAAKDSTQLPVYFWLLNWGTVGGFEFAGMGGAGAGPATAIIMLLELIAMLLVVRYSRIRASGFWQRFSAPDVNEILRLLKLGLPIGLAMFFEMAVFSIDTILIGRIGIEAVASHQIATSVTGIMFMVPLALGMAASIRVGFNVGRKDYVAARRSGFVALTLSMACSVIGVSIMLLGRSQIAGWYTNDVEVLTIATTLMLFAACFQPFDNLQVTSLGALRGYKDTQFPMVAALTAYWGVALPVGAVLGFGLLGFPELGVYGFWTALAVGLGLAAIVLSMRFNRLSRNPGLIDSFANR